MGSLEGWCLSSQVTIMLDGALLSWRWLNTCLSLGSSELITWFALLERVAFAFPVKLHLQQAMSFVLSTFQLSSPSQCRGERRQLSGAELPAGVNLQQGCSIASYVNYVTEK